MENPILIDKRKWDFRSFILIASTDPLLVFYIPGYLRFSLLEFDLIVDPWDNVAKVKHLPNTR